MDARAPAPSESDFADLAGYLNALANPSRLELLSQLRFPRTVREIHLRPTREESEGDPNRPISRTAVERHLLLLKAIGVVATRPGERDGRRVEEYVLQRARLFQVVERLRELMRLQPIESVALDLTVPVGAPRAVAAIPAGPSLRVLTGPDEGRIVPLAKMPFAIGRQAPADLVLDYDPYLSTRHALIRGADGAFFLEQDASVKNPTLLNWVPVLASTPARLVSGDVIGAGHTLLLFLVRG